MNGWRTTTSNGPMDPSFHLRGELGEKDNGLDSATMVANGVLDEENDDFHCISNQKTYKNGWVH